MRYILIFCLCKTDIFIKLYNFFFYVTFFLFFFRERKRQESDQRKQKERPW